MKQGLDGLSVDVLLYNDSTDNITDSDDIGAVTTEPASTNYARQTITLTAADISGDWGVDNDSQFSFDFTDVQPGDAEDVTVDTAMVVHNFQADDTGDASANDHAIATMAMSQQRNTGDVDSIDYAAGDLEITGD
jgi:hypothetical protein